jgi:hypothetical protein
MRNRSDQLVLVGPLMEQACPKRRLDAAKRSYFAGRPRRGTGLPPRGGLPGVTQGYHVALAARRLHVVHIFANARAAETPISRFSTCSGHAVAAADLAAHRRRTARIGILVR